jgi:hypothetical protein
MGTDEKNGRELTRKKANRDCSSFHSRDFAWPFFGNTSSGQQKGGAFAPPFSGS